MHGARRHLETMNHWRGHIWTTIVHSVKQYRCNKSGLSGNGLSGIVYHFTHTHTHTNSLSLPHTTILYRMGLVKGAWERWNIKCFESPGELKAIVPVCWPISGRQGAQPWQGPIKVVGYKRVKCREASSCALCPLASSLEYVLWYVLLPSHCASVLSMALSQWCGIRPIVLTQQHLNCK